MQRPATKRGGISVRVYPALLLICYFEVLLWTSCLLLSTVPITKAEFADSHSYLLREKGNLGLAGCHSSCKPVLHCPTQLPPAQLDLCVREQRVAWVQLLQDSLSLVNVELLQPALTTLRLYSKEEVSGLPAPYTASHHTPHNIMSEVERRQGGGLSIPLLRLPIPNPLAWLPRPRILGGRSRKRNFASTSVAISESVLSGASAVSGPSLPPAPTKVPLKPASDVLCGALARAASQSTIHPLDTLKVRIQARSRLPSPPPGVSKFGQLVPPPTAGPLRLDMKEMGKAVGSLYRGVFGAASGAGVAIGAYFAFYGAACNIISRNSDMSPSAVAFVSGGVAAIGSSVVKVPLAVCIRSVQAGVYPNVFAAARSIMTAVGPRGLFTGFLPTVLEDVPDMAIKFAAYETMRQVHSRFHKGRKGTPQEDFAMGAVAGSLAAAASTPLDVIKTNMMCTAASRPTMMAAARLVYQQGGMKAFFRGVGPRALSNGINSAVFFAFFEALRTAVANAKRANGGKIFLPLTPYGDEQQQEGAAGRKRKVHTALASATLWGEEILARSQSTSSTSRALVKARLGADGVVVVV